MPNPTEFIRLLRLPYATRLLPSKERNRRLLRQTKDTLGATDVVEIE